MSSVDIRIKREARLFKKEIDAAYARRLERLRFMLTDELYNMLKRCEHSGVVDRKLAPAWLHRKTYDETYRDYAPKTKALRTKERIEALLTLCDNDQEFFLVEYTKALNARFPIASKSFTWAPRLVKSDAGRLTVMHSWSRVRTPTP